MLPGGLEPDPSEVRRAGARRADVLGVIRASRPGIGIRALAEATGLHENTVRFHLDRLVAEGLVERRTGTSSGPGRPPLTFVARRDHHGAGHSNYELLARVLAEQLGEGDEAVAAAEEAGRAWGRSHVEGSVTGSTTPWPPAPGATPHVPREDEPPAGAIPAGPWDAALDELARVLDRAGFAPEITAETGAARVRVHNCPFVHLAREGRSVPCAVHLGLMDGVLEAAGSAGAVERLEPFVTPSLCVAHLRERGDGGPG